MIDSVLALASIPSVPVLETDREGRAATYSVIHAHAGDRLLPRELDHSSFPEVDRSYEFGPVLAAGSSTIYMFAAGGLIFGAALAPVIEPFRDPRDFMFTILQFAMLGAIVGTALVLLSVPILITLHFFGMQTRSLIRASANALPAIIATCGMLTPLGLLVAAWSISRPGIDWTSRVPSNAELILLVVAAGVAAGVSTFLVHVSKRFADTALRSADGTGEFCVHCGYPAGPRGICPECGTPFSQPEGLDRS